jgi:hypothetical protein
LRLREPVTKQVNCNKDNKIPGALNININITKNIFCDNGITLEPNIIANDTAHIATIIAIAAYFDCIDPINGDIIVIIINTTYLQYKKNL